MRAEEAESVPAPHLYPVMTKRLKGKSAYAVSGIYRPHVS
jgi:hypothetical protein